MSNLAPETSRHKCLIYDGEPSEQLPVVVPLLIDGLKNHWRCLYLGSPEMVQMVDGALADSGVNTKFEERRGALLFSSDRSHLDGGSFEPRRMIDGLCELIDAAVRDGFEGLSATGDMRWELGSDDSFDRLLEYEALLEQVFRDKPLQGICVYHRATVPTRSLQDALVTHQTAYIGQELNRDNLFYLPPELILDGSSASKQGEWMCQQIIRVLNAERTRDKTLAALRESEAHQRILAEQLAVANRDLERRVAQRTADLVLANRELESFSYSVSHDLCAPLRAIQGYGAILAEDCGALLGEKGARPLERLRAAARNMEELIEGLLTLARVARADLSLMPLSLTALAEEIVRELRDGAPERSVEVVIRDGLTVLGDPVLLRAALANLLGNAWKFTAKRESARIELGSEPDGPGRAVLFVADNGAGFAMERARDLFSPFQRLHRQEDFPGSGIGLATVHKIITKHGGRIWAEGRVDQGARFSFTLPSEPAAAQSA